MSDLISRKAAIDQLHQSYNLLDAERRLEDLPSAHPELHEWCTDCREYDQERHCCPRWNQVITHTLEDMKAEQRWIPAWQEFPQDNRFVLVCNDDGRCAVAQYIGHEEDAYHPWQIAYCPYDVDVWEDKEHGKIMAWMDLPKPYREGESDDKRGSVSTFERLRARILQGEHGQDTAAQLRFEQGND